MLSDRLTSTLNDSRVGLLEGASGSSSPFVAVDILDFRPGIAEKRRSNAPVSDG